MTYKEYGTENKKVIILLHGGGLSWWNYREVAKILSLNFHVVIPILDGHSGSDCDFTTIEDNAKKIVELINDNFGGMVCLIGGLSLGGQILLEVLSQKKDICKYALIESAKCIPSKFTYAMIKPAFNCCYGLIKRKWFSKLQFKSLRIKSQLFNDYYADTCAISKANMISFLKANSLYEAKPSLKDSQAKSYVFIGKKENGSIKKSAKIICNTLPNCTLQTLSNLHHGEFSINHPERYAKTVLDIINNE